MRNLTIDKNLWFIVFMYISVFLYGQNDHEIKPESSKDIHTQADHKKNLEERISANKTLFLTNPELAFQNAKDLMAEAIKTENHFAQLLAYDQYCWYYNRITDLNNLFTAANELNKKAKKYGNLIYEGVSHNYLSQAYTYNGMFDKAIKESEKAIAISKKMDLNEPKSITFRANTYIYISNNYHKQQKREEAVHYMRSALQEVEKIKDKKERKFWQYLISSNLSSSYKNYKPDSSEYFAKKSIALKDPDEPNDGFMASNYLTLADLYHSKGKYDESEKYYLEAEKISSKSAQVEEGLYYGLMNLYQTAGDKDREKLYAQKLKDIQFEQEKFKNQSLHSIIRKSEEEQTYRNYYIISGFAVLGAALLVLMYRYREKNKQLVRQEKQSQDYFQESPALPVQEKSYDKLIELVKNNDPGFMAVFHETFPGFLEKILAINPKLVQTEIEFCALLKLNISTHDIALYKNIELKSVRNKKYRIRKKLNIPNEIEIYTWFSMQ